MGNFIKFYVLFLFYITFITGDIVHNCWEGTCVTSSMCQELRREEIVGGDESCDNYEVCCRTPQHPVRPTVPVSAQKSGALLPGPGECGLPSSLMETVTGRVFAGSDVRQGEFPWVVALEYPGGEVECSGALINSRYVITAAHCMRRPEMRRPAPHKVRLGELVLFTDPDCDFTNCGPYVLKEGDYVMDPPCSFTFCPPKMLKIDIEDYQVFPSYFCKVYDIAIIRLKEYVPYSEYIHPICLRNDLPDWRDLTGNVTIVGWGIESYERSYYLLKATIPIRNDSFCDLSYGNSPYFVKDGTQICIGGGVLHQSCSGDSGGPAFMTDDHGIAYQVALTSFGYDECRGYGSPGVYTYLKPFMDFITSYLRD